MGVGGGERGRVTTTYCCEPDQVRDNRKSIRLPGERTTTGAYENFTPASNISNILLQKVKQEMFCSF